MGKKLLQDSYAFILTRKCEFGIRFYERLFLDMPTLKRVMPTNMKEQHEELLNALDHIVKYALTEDLPIQHLESALLTHVSYEEQDLYLKTFGQVLHSTLADMYGLAWSNGLDQVWKTAFNMVLEALNSPSLQTDTLLPQKELTSYSKSQVEIHH